MPAAPRGRKKLCKLVEKIKGKPINQLGKKKKDK